MSPTLTELNKAGATGLPGYLGIEVIDVAEGRAVSHLPVTAQLMAPNGFLHAGSIVSLADTTAGYGCMSTMPEGASGFTTIELKTNHLGTTRDGNLSCMATLLHGGRTTQVWDAVVTHRESGKTLALFRCTQMILYPR